jgi:hypothetical protein
MDLVFPFLEIRKLNSTGLRDLPEVSLPGRGSPGLKPWRF